ncbi:LysR family transcriptional regulator [Brevundimonas sp. CEF1]|uniref:LysR family transcriptional regulator n=1 Tax=Brevundimonas sp. CEF1 TaxID=3442642 RepID=UPI003F514466
MSILHLRSFVEVYRQGSVSKAAEELGLTQPAVSGHIASLEAQIERKLFIRHARGVKPTVIADELAARSSGAIDTAENVLAEFRARSMKMSGTIHLSGPSDILSDLVVDRLKALTARNLSIQLHPALGPEIITTLVEGRSDFAFALQPPVDARLEAASYGLEELLLVAEPGLAQDLSNSADLGAAMTTNGFLSYDLERYLLRMWVAHNGLAIGNAEEVVTTPDLRALRNFVVRGFGWSVLPRYLVAAELSAGSLVAVPGPVGNPSIEYFILWLKSAMRNPRTARAKALLLQSRVEGAPASE